jgi:hypothetical protein
MHKSAPKNKISHLCNVKCVTIPQMVNDQPSNACEANHHTGGHRYSKMYMRFVWCPYVLVFDWIGQNQI